jgi:fluoride ion exporter CrcB/FEX
MEQPHSSKPSMTKGQKRLLVVVYVMGAALVGLFVFVLGMIAWQIAHLK